MPGGKIAVTQANLRLVAMDNTKALDAALSQIEWALGKAALENESTGSQ
jgi:hypothetical protein